MSDLATLSARRGELVILGVLLGIGLLLRMHGIATVDYSFDESASWKTIQFSWTEMFPSISRNVHPPTFYVLLKLWSYVSGDGPAGLRLFSIVFGTLTIWAAWWFVREVCRTVWCCKSETAVAAPLIAAALLAFSPAHVSLGSIARMYTLGTFLALVSSTFVVRIIRSGGSALDWTGFSMAGVLLTLTHYYGLFTAASLALVIAGRMVHEYVAQGWTAIAKRLLYGGFLTSWGAATVWRFWLSTFMAQRAQVNQDYWISEFEWSNLSTVWTALLAGNETGAESALAPWSCLIFAAVVALLVSVRFGYAGQVVGAAAIIPVVAATVISINSQSIIVWRYFIFSQAFVLCGWALLIACQRSWVFRATFIGLSIGWNAGWSLQHWGHQQRLADCPGWQSAVDTLDRWRQADDGKVLVYDPSSYIIVQRYATQRDGLYVIDRGYRYKHYNAGPMLIASDYLSIDGFDESTTRMFVVHLPNWLGGVPTGWLEHRSQQFETCAERPQTIVVRELHRVVPRPRS